MQYSVLLLPRGATLKDICRLLPNACKLGDVDEVFTNGLDTFSALCVNTVIDGVKGGYNSVPKCSCSAPTRRLLYV